MESRSSSTMTWTMAQRWRAEKNTRLTPDDVANKRFSTVRFKEGYDETEVDAFLDEVVEELRRLNARIDELEAKRH